MRVSPSVVRPVSCDGSALRKSGWPLIGREGPFSPTHPVHVMGAYVNFGKRVLLLDPVVVCRVDPCVPGAHEIHAIDPTRRPPAGHSEAEQPELSV